jgi:hypothetical protein
MLRPWVKCSILFVDRRFTASYSSRRLKPNIERVSAADLNEPYYAYSPTDGRRRVDLAQTAPYSRTPISPGTRAMHCPGIGDHCGILHLDGFFISISMMPRYIDTVKARTRVSYHWRCLLIRKDVVLSVSVCLGLVSTGDMLPNAFLSGADTSPSAGLAAENGFFLFSNRAFQHAESSDIIQGLLKGRRNKLIRPKVGRDLGIGNRRSGPPGGGAGGYHSSSIRTRETPRRDDGGCCERLWLF